MNYNKDTNKVQVGRKTVTAIRAYFYGNIRGFLINLYLLK